MNLSYFKKTHYPAALLLISFWIGMYALIIFQDYVYSVLRETGFYWSEVTLHNGYYLLFIPFCLMGKKWIWTKNFLSQTLAIKIICTIVSSIIISAIHIVSFSAFFTLISHMLFSPPHLFSNTLISFISNDFYITFLVYTGFPIFLQLRKAPKAFQAAEKSYSPSIQIKQGNRLIRVEVETIYFFQTDKPYTALHTAHEKFLLPQSLQSIQQTLDPKQFFRIHRSTIIQKACIQELHSRQNGDYDVLMKNGKTLRMSRHYRNNWASLL